MKALRLHADWLGAAGSQRSLSASRSWKDPALKLENVPKPELRGHDLLLRVAFSGVCGSDYHLATNSENGTLFYPGLLQLPVTIGHEFSGIVEAHGPELSAREKELFPIGTPVTAEEMLWCGRCVECRAGRVNHCGSLEEIGFTVDGAHAEYLRIDAKYCWSLKPLAESIGAEAALQCGAMVEPYAVSFRGLFQGEHMGGWLPGHSVLVLGAGPIGLAAVDLALAAGAARVAVVEPLAERRETARKLGAEAAWDVGDNSPERESWDWIVDAAGATELACKLAASSLSVGGSIALLARTNETGKLDSEALITKNAKIFGSQGHSGESAFPRVITLMAKGKIHPRQLIREIISMEDAAGRLSRQEKCAGKLLLNPRTGNA